MWGHLYYLSCVVVLHSSSAVSFTDQPGSLPASLRIYVCIHVYIIVLIRREDAQFFKQINPCKQPVAIRDDRIMATIH